ncbi:hypothetical protein [Albibacterium sp.]|uniref:hypothetical protein n=1 Tax=Albibacterium sp. TaxID=2952885 RepID=UPI002CF3E1EC|nr:hypothetical protein [Albibacterium sp.]HUH20002.1 hypothetical protein [Albibacterium sp.]
MNCLIKYIIIACFLLPNTVFGQEAMRGVVLDYATEVRIGNAEITNLRTQQSVVSDGLGIFNIAGIIGDTLKIASTGYNEQNIVISSADDIVVRLKGITELKAVNVYGTTKEQELQGVMNDYRKQGSYYEGKPPVLAYIFNPISALHEAFGKTGKRVRRFQEYVNYEQGELSVDRKFNKSLVASLTDLKDEDLTNFMLIYRPSSSLVKNWNEYDATSYIKRAFEKFNADGRPKAPTLPKLVIPELSRE